MARAKAAAAADDTRTVKANAVARVIARRRPAQFGEMPDGRGGVVRWQLDGGQGEFSPPESVDQWVDDRISRCPVGTPIADVLVAVFEALRRGTSAVPEAVSLAAPLDAREQFAIWAALDAAPGGPAGIEILKAALSREWKRRGLAITPAAPLRIEPTDWNRPSEQARRVVYKTALGNPA